MLIFTLLWNHHHGVPAGSLAVHRWWALQRSLNFCWMTSGHQIGILREALGASFMNSMVWTPLLSRELRPGTGEGTAEQSACKAVSFHCCHPITSRFFRWQSISTHVLGTSESWETGTKAGNLGQNGLGWDGGWEEWTDQNTDYRQQIERERERQ